MARSCLTSGEVGRLTMTLLYCINRQRNDVFDPETKKKPRPCCRPGPVRPGAVPSKEDALLRSRNTRPAADCAVRHQVCGGYACSAEVRLVKVYLCHVGTLEPRSLAGQCSPSRAQLQAPLGPNWGQEANASASQLRGDGAFGAVQRRSVERSGPQAPYLMIRSLMRPWSRATFPWGAEIVQMFLYGAIA